MIDVGYYGDQELSVTVSIVGDVRNIPFKGITYNPEELKAAIERSVRKVHELMDQSDEVSPYISILSPQYSTDSLDSLLGRVVVEWEGKESEVTEEMIEAVEKEWGVPLPAELKKVVLACNGGGPIPMVSPYQRGSLYFQHLYSNTQDLHNIHEWKVHFTIFSPKVFFRSGKCQGYCLFGLPRSS